MVPSAPIDPFAPIDLYAGLPPWVQVLFWLAFVGALWSFGSVIVLALLAHRDRVRAANAAKAAHGAGLESDFLWVFVVPALNEEVTINDSVQRLRATTASNAIVLVVDDGSDDQTGAILDGIDDPRLEVLHRVAPNARNGKAGALNAAYDHLINEVLPRPEFRKWSANRVIVAVVDADGRLDADAPTAVSRRFADPEVGGVQTLVRIYNRRGWLTWAQDVEFGSFGLLFQSGRSWWGSANMGGNGQFNRLAALVTVADDEGPWRHRLTEDQDLGVRVLQAGWTAHQENTVEVQQQGLNSIRRLIRQRTRWAQGSWQALSLLPGSWRLRSVPLLGRIDAVGYLLSPAIQFVIGTAMVVSAIMWATGHTYRPNGWWILIVFVTIGFGPGVLTLAIRGGRPISVLTAIPLAIPYSIYSWIVFPVLGIGLVRQIIGRHSWAKTARESIASSPIDVTTELAITRSGAQESVLRMRLNGIANDSDTPSSPARKISSS